MKFLLRLMVLLPVLLVPARAESLLWMVDTPAGTSYLYGTIHLPHPAVNQLPPEVRDRLGEVDGVWTELPMDEVATIQQDLLKQMLLPSGMRLSETLDKATWSRLEQVMKGIHPSLSPYLFDQYNPILVSSLMGLLKSQIEYPLELPLDLIVWNAARAEGLQTGAIETTEEQIAAFNAFSLEEGIAVLIETMETMEKLQREGVDFESVMIDAYRKSDPETLQELLYEFGNPDSAVFKKMMRVLLDERNQRFAERITERIGAGGTWIFAFGAGHLGGSTGVELLLRKKGFTVTPVKLTFE